jgi:hypothetical protein
MSGEFLSRWSRLKEEARRAERGPQPEAEEPAATAPPPEAEPASMLPEPELTPEELAALPKLEEITAASDISGFLRRGVPDALRNAALRKMWTLDPAIRDFVGEARDYAYDWNTPGGVPGAGALDAGDDVAAMLRSVFGGSPPKEADAQPGVEGSQDREAVAASSGDASQVAASQREMPSEERAGRPGDSHAEAAPPADQDEMPDPLAAPQPEGSQKAAPSVAAHRHGGAKPV